MSSQQQDDPIAIMWAAMCVWNFPGDMSQLSALIGCLLLFITFAFTRESTPLGPPLECVPIIILEF